MRRKSKKEMVLDIYDREAMGEVTAREIAIINQALVEEYGEGGAMAPAEIARILVAEELPVRFEHVFRMMTPTEKYENLFDDLGLPSSLTEAEQSIRRLDELYRGFQRHGDKTGARFAIKTAQAAKKNAEDQVRSPKLSRQNRRIQLEIALWFTVWLQTPDLFPQWLELRKATKEFNDLSGEITSDGEAEPRKTGTK